MKLLLKLVAICFAFTLAAAPAALHAQDKPASKSEKSTTSKPAAKVDINTASVAALAKLPGVDSETANKIIAGRPYDNKAQLKSKNIITEALYNKITDQIIAKQPKKDGDTSKPKSDGKGKDKSKSKTAN